MTDTTGFGTIDPSLLERIQKTTDPNRWVDWGDPDPKTPQTRAWWVERNRAYAEKNIPRRFAAATTDLTEVHEWAYAVVADTDTAPSLLLAGPTGTGKTHAAYAALRLVAEACRAASWRAASTAALLGDLRPSANRDSEALMAQYLNCEVLFLDDLGAGKSSEWTEEILYRAIDHRYNNLRPCIFATNLAPHELAGRLGERTASRLAEMCQVLVIEGDDRRRQK
jgi:DNA replication protein DnaC